MKSKKSSRPSPQLQAPQQQAPQQQAPQQQAPQMNNALFAQQQQMPQMQAPQMQVPQMSNALFAQQQQMPQMQQVQAQQISNPYSNAVYTPQQQVPQRNVRGGMYGARNLGGGMQNQVFNDDQPLVEKVKQEMADAKIDLEIRAQRSVFKLKEPTILPAMATLTSSGGSRTSVDLICVIDNSGSMSGEKIELVKETMRFLLETLTPADRLSIITFNSGSSRLCGLMGVSGENMIALNNHINSIHAGGGTNIDSGLMLALKTIRDRKQANQVTSVFLLSDGQDRGAQEAFRQRLQLEENANLGVFSIHSFGFGADHDEDLMTRICEMKDGAFYFIKELATLDEAFCNALGGIISLAASEVVMKINNISQGLVAGIKIKKVYGSEKNWKKVNDKEYKVELTQMMSGISKDYVFELEIPAIDAEVGDLDRDHNIIEGIFMAKGVNGKNISGECVLKLTMLNHNEEIPEENENVDVTENYIRVKAAEAIEENIARADMQQFEEAQKGIDEMIGYIQSNKRVRKEKMDHLVEDLNQIRAKCSRQDYGSGGRKEMWHAQKAHSNQNNFQYSNAIQSEMVTKRKAMKKM